MNRGKNRIPKVAVVLVAIVMGISYVAAGSYAQQHKQPAHGGLQPRPQGADQAAESLNTIHSHRLPAMQSMLARAIRQLEAGRQQEALKELRQLEASLETTRQALGRHVEPPIVNALCPIMGSRIYPARVSASLTRMHDGQKVAFCCAGCPEAWDQLDGAQKTAKLASAITGSQPSRVQPQKAPASTQKTPAGSLQHGDSCSH